MFFALTNGGLEILLRLWSELCGSGLHTRFGLGRVEITVVMVGVMVKVGFRDKFNIIVDIRIKVELWVRVRVWVRLDSYNYSNIKHCPHQQVRYGVKYSTILRVVVWFRGRRQFKFRRHKGCI